ncbi:hypothetical protein BRARA_F02204 [Brassica rapa]|uniref:Uncharacterized protein n=2 Tax=Brassica campestris TaxID=3711 RepID=A0A397YZR6_BRACM|nr:hypothetical protein IGI04_023882 [Brassica rapa subsp. trilocularis]RID58949.1 hypothetical protein BRARA_F02204 [Brassica rapa]
MSAPKEVKSQRNRRSDMIRHQRQLEMRIRKSDGDLEERETVRKKHEKARRLKQHARRNQKRKKRIQR